MTDKQNMRPNGGWQEPTISVSVFVEADTQITADDGHHMSGGTWLDIKGEGSMTAVKICLHDVHQVVRMRDVLSAWIEEFVK